MFLFVTFVTFVLNGFLGNRRPRFVPRLELLERQLDPATVILGIDEYTACTFDPASRECTVMGAGSVSGFSTTGLRFETVTLAEVAS